MKRTLTVRHHVVTIVFVILAFATGLGFRWILTTSGLFANKRSVLVTDAWEKIHGYYHFLEDPGNYQYDADIGTYSANEPYDVVASLDVLVHAGELKKVDLVFPLVTNTPVVNDCWKKYIRSHDGIIDAIGNPEYADFKPAGKSPLHLVIWFKPTARADVKELITELDRHARKVGFVRPKKTVENGLDGKVNYPHGSARNGPSK